MIASHVIAVREIETLFTAGVEQCGRRQAFYLGPSHEWNLEFGCRIRPHFYRVTSNPAEPFRQTFLTAASKQLHAETDSQQRNLAFQYRFLKRRYKMRIPQSMHRRVESSYPRQHQMTGIKDARILVRDPRVIADEFEHVDQSARIANAVVDDRDHCNSFQTITRMAIVINAADAAPTRNTP